MNLKESLKDFVMLNEDTLIQCLILICRERLLNDRDNTSYSLINSLFNLDKIKKAGYGGELAFLNNLKSFIIELMSSLEDYTDKMIEDRLRIIFIEKKQQLDDVLSMLRAKMKDDELKEEIVKRRKVLNNLYRVRKVRALLEDANRNVRQYENSTKEFSDFVLDISGQLESLAVVEEEKDPAITDEFNLVNEEDVTLAINKVKKGNDDSRILVTGWKELNEMLQGGFRRREMAMFVAPQHNYKSGLLQSLFVQFCIHNKPILNDPNKKPAIIYISFEDDVSVYMEFMYKYIHCVLENELPDMSSVPNEVLVKYLITNLSKNGYRPITLKVDPDKWSYLHLFNKIMKLEAEGYEIHACIVDYLSKLPTVGCNSLAPQGGALKELYNRCKNFFQTKEISLITAHQLNSEAKKLLKNGLDAYYLPQEVASKGYTETCTSLDQIVDIEIAMAKAKKDKNWVLSFYLGKHRGKILVDEKKGFHLTFQPKRPLRETINDEEDLGENDLDI